MVDLFFFYIIIAKETTNINRLVLLYNFTIILIKKRGTHFMNKTFVHANLVIHFSGRAMGVLHRICLYNTMHCHGVFRFFRSLKIFANFQILEKTMNLKFYLLNFIVRFLKFKIKNIKIKKSRGDI